MEAHTKSFEVELNGTHYQVSLKDNGHFVINGQQAGGTEIFLEPGNLCLEWRSVNALDMVWVNQMGKLIYDHTVGNGTL